LYIHYLVILIQRLENIAAIQTGVFAKPGKAGEIVYLQAKHFDEAGNQVAKLHPDLFYSDVSIKHLLLPGDVLFAAKGFKNFAAVFELHNLPAVASTSFFVIRLQDENVLPGYIAWFMNHPVTQNLLKANAHGTAMVSISKAFLMEMEIPVPSLSLQQLVLKIAQLRVKEKNLIRQIENNKDQLTQLQLFKTIKR
jgi:restriction endonuclease S subunit